MESIVGLVLPKLFSETQALIVRLWHHLKFKRKVVGVVVPREDAEVVKESLMRLQVKVFDPMTDTSSYVRQIGNITKIDSEQIEQLLAAAEKNEDEKDLLLKKIIKKVYSVYSSQKRYIIIIGDSSESLKRMGVKKMFVGVPKRGTIPKDAPRDFIEGRLRYIDQEAGFAGKFEYADVKEDFLHWLKKRLV
jgi:hypothetical protein